MAVVTYNQKELCKFVGKDISLKEIENLITMLGMSLEKIEGNEITLDVTPNRIDMLSVEGLGRAMSSFLNIKTGLRTYEILKSDYQLQTDSSVNSVRPFIVSAVVKNLNITQECFDYLIQLQEKIHETFGRKRRKVSIGIHNLDVVKFPILYKAFKPKELSFIALDSSTSLSLEEILETHPKGKEYAHILKGIPKVPIVIDSKNNVLSFPPIINSKLTEVTTKTKNLFIEVTGTSENAIQTTLSIILAALADRGGKIYSVKSQLSTPDMKGTEMKLNPKNIFKILGIEISANQTKTLLERMGYSVNTGKGTTVQIPAYRADVIHEIDLIEDVAIAFDYNKIEPELPNLTTSGKLLNSFDNLKNLLIGSGFNQVITMTLTNPKQNYENMQLPINDCVEIKNPTTEEFSIMRTSIIPSLLSVFAQNKNQKTPQKLFEIGQCFEIHSNKLYQKTKLTVAILHSQTSVTEIKSIGEIILQELGDYGIERADYDYFIRGRSGSIKINNKKTGLFGEIHPQVLNNFDLEQPVSCLEIELEAKDIS
ncbi:phenylalanine--tRNA ligase subunit beta [Candidatus Micrarchaeota archaeon]|nr:phenylalanine--tRNA ligase subunit beta [Candidatus Micrarchaeota archaeon]